VASPDPTDVERFREIVARRFGLLFDASRLGQLADTLEGRLRTHGETAGAYLSRFSAGSLPAEEARTLIGELTVSETYFFRNVEQFDSLTDVALPARIVARGENRRLRILSAGCASGDEAYSIAMLVHNTPALRGWDVSIRGIDLSPAVVERARAARYTAWALRQTPPDIQNRFFRPVGREVVLDPEIRGMVTFDEANLHEDDAALWPSGALDIVFCRNVLMYLTPEAARGLVNRVSRSLVPGGYLYLGHAETLRGLSRAFHLRHTHETFYYQRREGDEPIQEPSGDLRREEPGGPMLACADVEDSWVESIRRASERIHSLTEAYPKAADDQAVARPELPGEGSKADLGPAVALLLRERYADAQALLGRLPLESADDPDALLLKAVLLTHRGQTAEAEEACRDLLVRDELNAGAHYLMALCREGAHDLKSAEEHDQTAAYLDPGFSMPRLHLGLLARRAGDREAARRELERAVDLLEHEDSARLLLFGGGFGRSALVALCAAELARCRPASPDREGA
jgi:chemotaxis protein methyltransferase CheR